MAGTVQSRPLIGSCHRRLSRPHPSIGTPFATSPHPRPLGDKERPPFPSSVTLDSPLSLPNSSTYLGGIVAGIPRDARLLGSFQFLTLLTTLGGIVAGNPGDARPLGCSQTSLTLLPPLGGIVAGIPGNARPLGRSQTFLTLPLSLSGILTYQLRPLDSRLM